MGRTYRQLSLEERCEIARLSPGRHRMRLAVRDLSRGRTYPIAPTSNTSPS